MRDKRRTEKRTKGKQVFGTGEATLEKHYQG